MPSSDYKDQDRKRVLHQPGVRADFLWKGGVGWGSAAVMVDGRWRRLSTSRISALSHACLVNRCWSPTMTLIMPRLEGPLQRFALLGAQFSAKNTPLICLMLRTAGRNHLYLISNAAAARRMKTPVLRMCHARLQSV